MDKKRDIIIIILLVLNILTVWKVCTLENKLSGISAGLSALPNQIQNGIMQVQSSVSSMLDEQATLIADYTMQSGALNPDTSSIPVTLTLSLKEYNDNTIVTLHTQNISVVMQKNGASYTARYNQNIFENEASQVEIDNGGNKKNEPFYSLTNLYESYLLNISGEFLGDVKYAPDQKTLHYNGDIPINIYSKNPTQISNIELSAIQNTTELFRKQLPASQTDIILGEQEDGTHDTSYLNIPLKETLTVQSNEEVYLYLYITDINGYTYQYLLNASKPSDRIIGKKPEPSPTGSLDWSLEIKDKTGTIVHRS